MRLLCISLALVLDRMDSMLPTAGMPFVSVMGAAEAYSSATSRKGPERQIPQQVPREADLWVGWVVAE